MSPPSPSDARARCGAYPAPFRRSSSHSELSSAGGSARSPPRRAGLFATSRLEEEGGLGGTRASSGDSSSDEASGLSRGRGGADVRGARRGPRGGGADDLFDLAVRMSGEVATKTRRRRLKTHADSFTGRQAAVDVSANVAEDVEAALALGGGLVKAGLIKGPLGFESITSGTYASGTPSKTAASRTQSGASHHGFANRSFLYRFNVAMDPGLRAARWCLSREMVKVRGSVHDVATVVDRHTAAARALADDHAAAMERLENVLREMKTQLAKARAAGVALAIALGAHAVEAAFVGAGRVFLGTRLRGGRSVRAGDVRRRGVVRGGPAERRRRPSRRRRGVGPVGPVGRRRRVQRRRGRERSRVAGWGPEGPSRHGEGRECLERTAIERGRGRGRGRSPPPPPRRSRLPAAVVVVARTGASALLLLLRSGLSSAPSPSRAGDSLERVRARRARRRAPLPASPSQWLPPGPRAPRTA